MIASLKDQLIRDEGLRLKPYKDSVGKLTIGIGRNLDDDGISILEANLLFENDRAAVILEVQQALPWALALDPVRLGAVQNLTFNMGAEKLQEFVKFIAAMKSQNWAQAKADLLNSAADHQEPNRIDRLAAQIVTGVWQ